MLIMAWYLGEGNPSVMSSGEQRLTHSVNPMSNVETFIVKPGPAMYADRQLPLIKAGDQADKATEEIRWWQ
jgi:hypothetical protein